MFGTKSHGCRTLPNSLLLIMHANEDGVKEPFATCLGLTGSESVGKADLIFSAFLKKAVKLWKVGAGWCKEED